MFDVTMGSYDGAETCELIGTYMLSLITANFKDQVGLYRDNGLAVCKATPREIEKIKQQVSNAFKSNDLKIMIEANKKIGPRCVRVFNAFSVNGSYIWDGD